MRRPGPFWLAVIVAVAVVAPRSEADSTFSNQARAFPANVEAVILADLDGDGRSDALATHGFSPGIVSVLMAAGDGDLAPGVAYPAGDNPRGLVAGDFDGDDVLDVAVANSFLGISILIGNGDGSLASPVTFPAGVDVRRIAAADLDDDGDLDLALSDRALGAVIVLLNDGSGSFAIVATSPVGSAPQGIAAGDLDDDGAVDLVVANSGSSGSPGTDISVLYGNGDGTFEAEIRHAVGDRPIEVVIADLDADGRQDVAVANQDSRDVSALLGRNNGALGNERRSDPLTAELLSLALIGDLNGDGRPALAVGSSEDLVVMTVVGNGPLSAVCRRSPGWAVASGLVDDDALPDVLTLSEQLDYGVILPGRADGTIGRATITPFGSDDEQAGPLATADFDGDGVSDVLVAGAGGALHALAGQGDGTFASVQSFAYDYAPSTIALGDVNVDGATDAIALFREQFEDPDEPAAVLLGQGDGSFVAHGTLSAVFGNDGAIVDAAGDGTPDLVSVVLAGSIRELTLTPGDGAGGFDAKLVTTLPAAPVSVAVGDWDGDGLADAAVAMGGDGGVGIFLGDGSGGWISSGTYLAGRAMFDLVASDLDADGVLDLAVASWPTDGLAVLLGDGAGGFVEGGVIGDLPYFEVQVADVASDGRPDLVARALDVATLFSGDGTGGFVETESFGLVGSDPDAIVLADADGDRRIDVIAATRGHLVVLSNQGNHPPLADAGPDRQVTLTSPAGAEVVLDGTLSSDVDGDLVAFEWFTDAGTSDEALLGNGSLLAVQLAPGEHVVTLRVTDAVGAFDLDAVTITVGNGQPADVELTASPSSLWPPNHRLVPVTVTVTPGAGCATPMVELIAVDSSEPEDAAGNGDGATGPDIADATLGTADLAVTLRAERASGGSGRVYVLTYEASCGGAPQTIEVEVSVPHDQGGIVEPVAIEVTGAAAGTLLSWTATPGASGYDVARGDLTALQEVGMTFDLGAVVCVEAGSEDTSSLGHEDTALPEPGTGFYYVVRYHADSGDSGYGTVSAAKPRVVAAGDCL